MGRLPVSTIPKRGKGSKFFDLYLFDLYSHRIFFLMGGLGILVVTLNNLKEFILFFQHSLIFYSLANQNHKLSNYKTTIYCFTFIKTILIYYFFVLFISLSLFSSMKMARSSSPFAIANY